MLVRLTVTTVLIALFGLSFGTLVQTKGHSSSGVGVGQAAGGCLTDGTFCSQVRLAAGL